MPQNTCPAPLSLLLSPCPDNQIWNHPSPGHVSRQKYWCCRIPALLHPGGDDDRIAPDIVGKFLSPTTPAIRGPVSSSKSGLQKKVCLLFDTVISQSFKKACISLAAWITLAGWSSSRRSEIRRHTYRHHRWPWFFRGRICLWSGRIPCNSNKKNIATRSLGDNFSAILVKSLKSVKSTVACS